MNNVTTIHVELKGKKETFMELKSERKVGEGWGTRLSNENSLNF